MPLYKKALIGGLLTGVFGLILVPFMWPLEEDLGLGSLFKIRGKRQVPSDVVVVTLDKESADHLHLPPEPYKWPRSLHARLTQNLAAKGAAVIAFDLIFKEHGAIEDDTRFAEAIRDAGNVVLCEQLDKDAVPMTDVNSEVQYDLKIESLVPLIPELARTAVATAPFPLPKVPVRVSQYWKFKQGAGGIPTFPVVSFQVYALGAHDDFADILKRVAPAQAETLSFKREGMPLSQGLENLMHDLKDVFSREPMIAEKMLAELEKPGTKAIPSKRKQVLKSLIMMYQGGDSNYLDFYGPPGAIHTIPFYQLVSSFPPLSILKEFDLKGKAVFVGLSERLRPEEKDGFHTAYSQANGVDISGVEIAATAFANLLENRPVQPLSPQAHMAAVFLCGLLLGVVCRTFPTMIAAAGVAGLGALYLAWAYYQFKTASIWPPLVLPLLGQGPLAFFGSVLWKYVEAHQERENVKKALGYYVPGKVVHEMAKDMGDIRSNKQPFLGTCLCTDAEKYTTLSEAMDPEDLGRLMNQYFEVIFEPVKKNDGSIAEVVGDTMIAVWPVTQSEASHRIKACLAALDIVKAVNQFNESNPASQLPTRIGLHAGHMMMGNIGAMDRYEYNPIGDMVNTASRLEGLNKKLGTRILASREVVYDLDDFLTRDLGAFVLAGKSNPVVVRELICRRQDADPQQEHFCMDFSKALDAFRNQAWDRGLELFSNLIKTNGEDGPSRFYLEQCKEYQTRPFPERLDGAIILNSK